MSRFFESLISQNLNPKLCVNWLNTELMGLLKGELTIEKFSRRCSKAWSFN